MGTAKPSAATETQPAGPTDEQKTLDAVLEQAIKLLAVGLAKEQFILFDELLYEVEGGAEEFIDAVREKAAELAPDEFESSDAEE